MKKILLHFIYLAASVVISLYDVKRAILPATDQQDKKRKDQMTMQGLKKDCSVLATKKA
jgi:hypothetical protein